MKIADIAIQIRERIPASSIRSEDYVSTDNMRPNFSGIAATSSIPPTGTVTAYKKDDILLSNIRPYFRKTWLATHAGGCNADILCLRTDPIKCLPPYLYYLFTTDNFVNDYLKSCKGAKMPRGDVNRLMNYEFSLPDLPTQLRIAGILGSLDEKIELNRRKIAELEALAKTIYDYWFVQFDFPDANGRPYKSSGGKTVWNEQLKREVPEGWESGNLYDIATFENGLACQRFRPKDGEKALPVIKIREMHEGMSADTEFVSVNIPSKHKITDGDLLFSWSASLEAMIWCGGDGGLNQHIFKVTPKNGYSTEYVFHQLSAYIGNFAKMAEARKTTMGHITSAHLEQSRIILPNKVVLKGFADVISPVFWQMVSLRQEIRALVAQRDTLLPLLMNGQVEVTG